MASPPPASARLGYELGLLLAMAADHPETVDTGSDEPAAAESARLLGELGVGRVPVAG